MHRADPTAHGVGRADLGEGDANDHAHHLCRAEHAQGEDGQHEIRGDSEHAGSDTVDDHGTKEGGADAPLERIVGEKNGGGEGAHRRRGAEHAEADRARAEDVARVHGQERGRTPRSTAKRSRDMVPRSTRRLQMKPTPEKTVASVTGSRVRAARLMRMAAALTPARMNNAPAVKYAAPGPSI